MAFVLSKLFWALLAPVNVVLIVLILSALALVRRPRAVMARILAVVAGLTILACGALPIGYFLVAPLEERFPKPAAPPAQVDGIVVLGGSVRTEISVRRGETSLNETAERLFEAVALARRYPQARRWSSGGDSALIPTGNTEAAVAERFFVAMGVAPGRVQYEARSRNTYENARYTLEEAGPAPGETWLLVTSAKHMPRAVGCFRAVGWGSIQAWPVDYTTVPEIDWWLNFDLATGLTEVNAGLREWIGLAAYRVLGYTSALFPGP